MRSSLLVRILLVGLLAGLSAAVVTVLAMALGASESVRRGLPGAVATGVVVAFVRPSKKRAP